jgi:hypothetical protein
MKSKKENKSNKLKLVINLSITIMTVFVIILLGSFIYQQFFSDQIDSEIFDNASGLEIKKKTQIGVLNGCGVDGLASRAKKYMDGLKFDVVDVGNYDSTVEKSFIIDRVGDWDAAVRSAEAFGINDTLIFEIIDSSKYLKNTIIIGLDYKEMKPFKQ